MSREHKRPMLAFVIIAVTCGVLLVNAARSSAVEILRHQVPIIAAASTLHLIPGTLVSEPDAPVVPPTSEPPPVPDATPAAAATSKRQSTAAVAAPAAPAAPRTVTRDSVKTRQSKAPKRSRLEASGRERSKHESRDKSSGNEKSRHRTSDDRADASTPGRQDSLWSDLGWTEGGEPGDGHHDARGHRRESRDEKESRRDRSDHSEQSRDWWSREKDSSRGDRSRR